MDWQFQIVPELGMLSKAVQPFSMKTQQGLHQVITSEVINERTAE